MFYRCGYQSSLIDIVKAAVLEGVGTLAVHGYPKPEVEESTILMSMVMCGVCGIDINL